MNIAIFKTETIGDPLGRGYSSMTDEQVMKDGQEVYRTRNKTSLTGSEILNAIDKTEFSALSIEDKQMIWNIIHLGTINPFGIEAALFQDIFGASVTITALLVLRVENISRWEELGIRGVRIGHVGEARV